MVRKAHVLALAFVCAFAGMALSPRPADAQTDRRAVRRPAGRSVVIVTPRFYRPAFYYPGYYYDPFFYPGFFYGRSFWPAYYGGFGWGWYGQYPHPPYGVHRPLYDTTGSARIQVEPKNTEVYLDGHFVGVVDDFDGYLQRLHAPAGEHELTFYLEGYRTRHEKVLFRPRATLRIQLEMEPLAPGEAQDPRPGADEYARPARDPGRRVPVPSSRRAPESRYGTLSLGVQPADALVLINGAEWDRPEGESRFTVDLPDGIHRIEIRKDGLAPYSRTVEIRQGQTVTLNVSLTTGG